MLTTKKDDRPLMLTTKKDDRPLMFTYKEDECGPHSKGKDDENDGQGPPGAFRSLQGGGP